MCAPKEGEKTPNDANNGIKPANFIIYWMLKALIYTNSLSFSSFDSFVHILSNHRKCSRLFHYYRFGGCSKMQPITRIGLFWRGKREHVCYKPFRIYGIREWFWMNSWIQSGDWIAKLKFFDVIDPFSVRWNFKNSGFA